MELMGLPQDYEKPRFPCRMCHKSAWYQRTKARGSGWACSGCSPSAEMIDRLMQEYQADLEYLKEEAQS